MRESLLSKEEREERYRTWKNRRDADAKTRATYLSKSTGYSLKKRYGVSTEQVDALASFQGCVCAICGAPPDAKEKRGGLHIDHDHASGAVRGLLCEPCNLGLGFFRDDVSRLGAAIEYLRNPPAALVPSVVPEPRPSRSGGGRNPEKQVMLDLLCKQCGRAFQRWAQAEFHSRAKGKEGPFCSQKCSGTWAKSLQPPAVLVHGTTNGYTGHKCRCTECRAAHAAAARILAGKKRIR